MWSLVNFWHSRCPKRHRAVKTRRERNKSDLGYSSIWEKYDRDQTQRAQLENPDIGIVCRWVESHGCPESTELVMQVRAIRFYWHIFDTSSFGKGIHQKGQLWVPLTTGHSCSS